MRVQVSLRAQREDGKSRPLVVFVASELVAWYFHFAMDVRAHIVIRGIVQGVGFRYYAANQASKLNLYGYARNLFNGDVEVEVEGERGSIEEFIKMLAIGPRLAKVDDVVVQWERYTGKYRTFEIR